MFIIKSLVPTTPVSASVSPEVVDIDIPVEKSIPAGNGQFAADSAGITIEKYKLVAAVAGADARL